MNRIAKIGLWSSLGIGVYCADKYLNASALQRNLRTLSYGALIALDYKLNYSPENASAVNSRSAERMLHVCKSNAGLYIKFGQQVNSVPVLPTEFRIFRELYDNAPGVPYAEVEALFLEEFGVRPLDMFETFELEPVASASIAQVHKATLKDGSQVAVKVQKPAVRKQIGLDLFNYRIVLYLFEKLFDLPLYWSADYIEDHLRQEVDFVREGKNAERCLRHVKEVPSLDRNVYVPTVIWSHSSKRVLTCEWIEGVRYAETNLLRSSGFPLTKIMETMVDLFSDQIFRVGFVHCDPHVGNIIIRHHPARPKDYQLVLLDHGLYIQSSEAFRRSYCLFWKSLYTLDMKTMETIAKSWGISDVQIFASSTIQKPWKPGKNVAFEKTTLKDLYDSREVARERFKHFLKDSKLLPQELIFIARNMNIVRTNNWALGSPVNRINRMANSAVQALGSDVWNPSPTWIGSVVGRVSYWTFQSTLLLTSVSFHTTRWIQSLNFWLFGIRSRGFEDLMDATMRKNLEKELPGLVVDPDLFDG